MNVFGSIFRTVFLAGVLLSFFPACAPNDGRPNVVLIVIDTLRRDALSCYGSREVRTPSIDRLAEEGALFESAVTAATVTFPSICSIMTGRYPYDHHVRSNETYLNDRFITLAEMFRAAGYRTGAVVGSAVLAAQANLDQGFEQYDDRFSDDWKVYDPALRNEGIGAGSVLQRRAGEVTDRAISWMKNAGDGPFFLFAHYFDPHSNYDPPPPFRSEYAGKPYYGEAAYTDREVGRLLEWIDRRGLSDRTVILLTADHGEGFGEHNEYEHGFFVYESTSHIPMILRWPGEVAEGERITGVVSTIDIAPTLAGLAGLDIPEGMEGIDAGPLLRGIIDPGRTAYTEAFRGYTSYGWAPTRSVRDREWKFIEAPSKELYHLSVDPTEGENLYESRPDVAARLGMVMEEHLRSEKEVRGEDRLAGTMDKAQRERLEALGYATRGKSSHPDGPLGGDLPDPTEAVLEFNALQRAKILCRNARLAIDQGRPGDAKPLLEEAVKLDGDYFPALSLLAEVYVGEGRKEDAERLFLDVLEGAPSGAEAYANASAALVNLGRTADAVKAMREAVRLDPDNTQYRRMLDAFEKALATGEKISVRVNFR